MNGDRPLFSLLVALGERRRNRLRVLNLARREALAARKMFWIDSATIASFLSNTVRDPSRASSVLRFIIGGGGGGL
ncbi:MAG: hypothetical protein R2849_20970 [Thermomicrobiales bacterium]